MKETTPTNKIDQNIFDIERNFHGAKGLVFIGNKILVYRRDNNTKIFPLCIDLPGGGREENESPFDTFKRETQEEFGIVIGKEDVRYAKKYQSVMDSTKESYFIVVKPSNIQEGDIVFGDEGLEFMLIDLADYLNLDDAIERHKNKVRDYLNSA